MSKFVDAMVGAKIPFIDSRIKNIVYFTSNFQLDVRLIKLFEMCFWALAEQLESEDLLDKKVPYVTCLALNNDMFTIQLDENQLGMITALAVYPIYRWNGFPDNIVCTFILEELCHCLWCIRDEVEVNFKVFEIMKRIYLKIKMRDLYNVEWMNEELKKQGKTPIDFDDAQ